MGFPQGKSRAMAERGRGRALLCVCACVRVRAAPGLPLTSSLFRSIREQIPARGERRCRPRHTGSSREGGGMTTARPGLSIGCRGPSGQPGQPMGSANIEVILISLIIINLPLRSPHPPPPPTRPLSAVAAELSCLRRWMEETEETRPPQPGRTAITRRGGGHRGAPECARPSTGERGTFVCEVSRGRPSVHSTVSAV